MGRIPKLSAETPSIKAWTLSRDSAQAYGGDVTGLDIIH